MRVCPFHGCKMMISTDLFACRIHWKTMSKEDREAIMDAWLAYQNDKLDLTSLRARQDEIMDRIQGPRDSIDRRELVAYASRVDHLLAQVNCVLKLKEQNVTVYKKALGELRKLMLQIGRATDAIIHPPRTQPTLFEEPPGAPPESVR